MKKDWVIRFESKFERGPGCWLWKASKLDGGYGSFHAIDRTRGAHRVAYELYVGPIPPGFQLDHLCRKPACVNPAHLEPVTISENVRRAQKFKRRKTPQLKNKNERAAKIRAWLFQRNAQ